MEEVVKPRPIIVPWDFTEMAKNAFLHAYNFSRILNCEIILLHLVKHEADIPAKEEQLKVDAEELAKTHDAEIRPLVQAGSIFKVIGTIAKELHAEMIIMGTHGRKGSQKIFGSNALKVIVSSRTPYLIIQDKPKKAKIDSILLPIDFKKENKEKAAWIYHVTARFETKVTIYKSFHRDKGFKAKLLSNMRYIKTYLKLREVKFSVVSSRGEKSFKKGIVKYAHENDFDMILIMATRDIKRTDYLFGAPEQYIISNEHKIPVMCINPKPRKVASGFRASGG